MRKWFLVVSACVLLTACDLAPELKLPEVLTPAFFKEDKAELLATVEPATDGKWKRFDDKAQIEEFAWWRMFNDDALNALEEQALKENPSLEAALARVTSARALADDRGADLYPAIEVGVGPERQRQSPASQQANLPPGSSAVAKPYTLYTARGVIKYELDLFGRNRGLLRAALQDAEAEAENLRTARLSLQAELAQTYFRVAALRQERGILEKTIATRTQTLEHIHEKHSVGAVDTLALSAAETDLSTVKISAASLAQQLATQEHALAILVGKPPSELSVETPPLIAAPPSVPAGLPSSLLERRPDIRQAVALIAAANERIGIARTGYFPDISLSAVGGFVSGDLDNLFDWSNRTWLIGPLAGTVLTQPIFEGGRIAAARAQTQANYEAAVAQYRASVLQAFREVEDQLSGVRTIADQFHAANDAFDSATRAHAVASARFNVGYSSHLDYLDAERSLLNAERSRVQALGEQYVTTVQLIKALGGSWQAPTTPEAIAAPMAAAD